MEEIFQTWKVQGKAPWEEFAEIFQLLSEVAEFLPALTPKLMNTKQVIHMEIHCAIQRLLTALLLEEYRTWLIL